MQKRYRKALFIFRRDLRLEDNTGLIYALKNSEAVIPAFIFTPEQITHNPFKSERCLQFMIESLEDLNVQLEKKQGSLYVFFDTSEKVVERCLKELKVDAVIVNRDYTPYSIQRDTKIERVCKQWGGEFHAFDDALLHTPEDTLKSDGKPYTIFTPFYRNATRLDVLPSSSNPYSNYYNKPIPFAREPSLFNEIVPLRLEQFKGGRRAALRILKDINLIVDYKQLRDFPAKNATTHLSAHLKFTTCSIREVYHAIEKALGRDSDLIRSLFWRDFFSCIAYHFPHVFEGCFHRKLDKLPWENDEKKFKCWCEGRTGFPFVDAGMREMNQTGYMQNRVRMIVAAFLVKDLHIDWRWGEKYFAKKLIDYDPAVNNGNWQWSASTGCDAQPYFRIFNPWTQQKKFDEEGRYIKKWIPELMSLPIKNIHEWYRSEHQEKLIDYPQPLVDHSIETQITLDSYKRIV